MSVYGRIDVTTKSAPLLKTPPTRPPSMRKNAEATHGVLHRMARWVNEHRTSTFAVAITAGMLFGAVVPGAVIGAIIAALVVFACSRVCDKIGKEGREDVVVRRAEDAEIRGRAARNARYTKCLLEHRARGERFSHTI
ncbi:MAG: hypothetical protein OXF02_04120 [Simkaniaceae bacterium]|nr:hypothetical protein [Simkaniaceae bacterium]